MSSNQPVILTGDRPTGQLHLGHFVARCKTAWPCRTATASSC